jgi:hypothetical protein
MKAMASACLILATVGTVGCAQAPPASPYAGQEGRSIKALSQKEVDDLRAGAGMGYAKAAELNRYPGPAHALEWAERLGLSPAQRSAIEEILKAHKAEARMLGGEAVGLEEELDALFAKANATPEGVDAAVGRLASVTGRLRASHLKAHIATARVLTAAQVDRYVELRGYATAHQH